MPASDPPEYLQPYLNAAKKYGAGFGSLLWASPKTQATRFAAIARAFDLNDRVVLDVGCGRADLRDFLSKHRIVPREYIGLEAVDELAAAAEGKKFSNARIVRGDFVLEPTLMDVAADVVIFCGSLNTLDERTFYQTLLHSFEGARLAVVFNFLNSPELAASSYLTWHIPQAVLAFAEKLSSHVRMWDNYLKGDSTVLMKKEAEPQVSQITQI
jgi:hypothetical protein